MSKQSPIWMPGFSAQNQVVTNAVQKRGMNIIPGIQIHFYESPSFDKNIVEFWSYTDKLSYCRGDTVKIHMWASTTDVGVQIYKDGVVPKVVYKSGRLQGKMHETPDECFASGCDWPVAHTLDIPIDWPTGVYILETVADVPGRGQVKQEHFFVVRAGEVDASRALFVLSTATYTAYNAWGGANHYEGITGADEGLFSPVLSLQRPWERGFVRLPDGAPRIVHEQRPGPNFRVRNDDINWAYSLGYSKQYASAGWAIYDRIFAIWAEQNGYQLDFATQHDLHFQSDLLDGYKLMVMAGHDEYWSREMRDAADSFVDAGGNVAYLGANFFWQIRLESEGDQQICYKWHPEQDPVYDTPDKSLTTTAWSHPSVNQPGAETRGVHATYGVFAHYGGATPRASGGYTVYRDGHWVFEDTDLYFGDLFGHEAGIFGFEVDGVDFTFTDALPVPTYEDGAPESLQILAMSPCVGAETVRHSDVPHLSGEDLSWLSTIRYGDDSPENQARTNPGAGMMVAFERGEGQVFSSGTTDWVYGLKYRDFFTEQITKNVLNRFLA
jgi:hypothetical protein